MMSGEKEFKILFSNLGYARGIDGSLLSHITNAGRHIYCGTAPQKKVLKQLKSIITGENPDLCCFVEIDSGSLHSSYFNQMDELRDDVYPHSDIAGKYGEGRALNRISFMDGKSNGFLTKKELKFKHHFFSCGSKRLIYEIQLKDGLHIFFTHFALSYKIRQRQFQELHSLVANYPGHNIVLADFNIFKGFDELKPLLQDSNLQLLNQDHEPTFLFHRTRRVLDLCLCSRELIGDLNLKIIPQPYSDHAALLVTMKSHD